MPSRWQEPLFCYRVDEPIYILDGSLQRGAVLFCPEEIGLQTVFFIEAARRREEEIMKRLCLYLLIASIISGCAATNITTQQTSAAGEEAAPALHDENNGIDTLAPETQLNKAHDERTSSPIATLNYLLKKANDRVGAIAELLTPDSIPPDPVIDPADSLSEEDEEQPVEAPRTQIEIRLLVDNADEAMEEIRNLGEVVHYKVVEPDINDDFLYSLLGLENSLKMRERLLAILADAANVQEVLKVERQLGRLNCNIDSLKARLQKFSSEAPSAGVNTPADSTTQTKPSLVRSILYYTCQGLSWLFIKK